MSSNKREVIFLASFLSLLLIILSISLYLLLHKRKSGKVEKKIKKARELGYHEPFTIHPKIDPSKCIGSGACVKACPEKDILGLSNGRGVLINTSHCVGHGACAAACPVGAITLVFGTETRGVEIPYVSPNFETNIQGVFIIGELGGMGLIKNAITQGREAIDFIACGCSGRKNNGSAYDAVIIGAGPAGIGASLAAMKHQLSFVTVEQDDIGGTVLQYPRHKVVMTSSVELPLFGKMRLKDATKEALLGLWTKVIKETGLVIRTNEKMTALRQEDGGLFAVVTSRGEYLTRHVVLAIGRRGTPRKLGVPGEQLPKVAYRLLDPDQHRDHEILVVGGGDSAVEAAMALARSGNNVTISYRGENFARIRPANKARLDEMLSRGELKSMLNSNVKEIMERDVRLDTAGGPVRLSNDYVYVFIGGEMPNDFLKSIGVRIEKKFGRA